jgi:hypothetical protein
LTFIDSVLSNVNTGQYVISGDSGSIILLENFKLIDFTGSGLFVKTGTSVYTNIATFQSKVYLDGQAETGGGIYCVACGALEIYETTFQNITTELEGGCIFASDSTSAAANYINNSKFLNCIGSQGGGAYISNRNIHIAYTEFINNSAGTNTQEGEGGSLFLNYINNSSDIRISDSVFKNSFASLSGGAIQWYGSKPVILSTNFSFNNAHYGKDIGSFPNSLLLGSPVYDFAPGQKVSSPMIVKVIDHYGQQVLTDFTTGLELIIKYPNFSVTGTTKIYAELGFVNYSDFAVTGPPGSETNLTVLGYLFVLNTYVESDLDIKISLRKCYSGESLVSNNTCKVCEYGKYNLIPGSECIACPYRAICYGGNEIVAAKGYWRTSNNTDAFFSCPNTDSCLEEQLGVPGHCLTGYEGNLCQSCSYGYSRSGDNQCSECMSRTENIVFTSLIAFSALVVIVIMTATTIQGAYKEQSIGSIYIKILVNYFQIVLLTISFNLEWPSLVKQMFSIQQKPAGSSNQLFSIDCFLTQDTEPYFAKLVLLGTIPVICGLLSLLFWAIWSKIKKCSNLKEKIIGSAVIQLFIFQPSLVKYNFAMFDCMEIGPGEYYMTSEMSIQCWRSDHMFYLLVVALPSIAIWCILVPILLVSSLYRTKNGLLDISQKVKYGFLYKGYKTDKYYWEFLTMLRKITIISLSVFLRNFSVRVQALSTFMVIAGSYLLQKEYNPYISDPLNNLERLSIIVSAVTIYSGIFFLTKDLDNTGELLIFVVMAISNIAFLGYWLYHMSIFYLLKVYYKLQFCQKCFGKKFNLWAQKILPVNSHDKNDTIANEVEVISRKEFEEQKYDEFMKNINFTGRSTEFKLKCGRN